MSRLLGDPIYETYARKAIAALWKIRDEKTGLLGNVMNIKTGQWISKVNNEISVKISFKRMLNLLRES